jgi:hypothetical protein
MPALLEARLPTGEPWLYEPKRDGLRGLLWHRCGPVAELLSSELGARVETVKALLEFSPSATEAAMCQFGAG